MKKIILILSSFIIVIFCWVYISRCIFLSKLDYELVEDSRRLYDRNMYKVGYISKTEWPDSIIALDALRITIGSNGLIIVRHSWAGNESGIFIPNKIFDTRFLASGGGVEFKQLKPEIFEYSTN